jgi:hypothetical protein
MFSPVTRPIGQKLRTLQLAPLRTPVYDSSPVDPFNMAPPVASVERSIFMSRPKAFIVPACSGLIVAGWKDEIPALCFVYAAVS